MSRAADVIGQVFGRLTVVAEAEPGKRNQRRVRCRCECGTETVVHLSNLRKGYSKSCGCLARETASRLTRTHGRTGTVEYRSWQTMLRRCFNKKTREYRDYGGRGITVCGRWRKSFESFYQDMGPRPSSGHSLDRVDNMRGYNCGNCDECVAIGNGANCRWATRKVQARNTRRNVWIEADGNRMLATDRAAALGISRQAMAQRLAAGWSDEAAATRSKRGAKLYGGKTLSERAKETGIPYSTLTQRVASGWNEEDLFLPIGKRPRRCGACGNAGHNAATCTRPPVLAETG